MDEELSESHPITGTGYTDILHAVEENNLEKIEELVSTGHSLNIFDHNGNTPLHIAIIKNNIQIIRYLVTQDDIDINARNYELQSPLFLAVRSNHFESVKTLIEKGANVNLPCRRCLTPLHLSVQYPDIAHILIKNEAEIDLIDCTNDTPLHYAVSRGCIETVCMLLYYGADANVLGHNNCTPFIRALIDKNVEIQDALFNYIDDYTNYDSTLTLAVKNYSPYVEEIIKRGAKVTAADFKACVAYPHANNFKLIWSNLTLDDVNDDDVNLSRISHNLNKEHLEQYIEIIMENSDSSVLEVLAQKTSNKYFSVFSTRNKDMTLLIEKKLNNNCLTKLILLWLEYGFTLDTYLINEIFLSMGYCELFKILLFMDYVGDWNYSIAPRLIFDIHSDILTLCVELTQSDWNEYKRKVTIDAMKSLHYWKNSYLVDIAFKFFKPSFSFGSIPSLVELARDHTRKYIVRKFNMKTSRQYYTYVNCLDISRVYKKILMYEKKIYK